MSDIKVCLGKRIKEIRKQRGFSQEFLAEKVGIEPNNLSRIENGRNYPMPGTLEAIASALDVSIDVLFAFNHHKEYSLIKEELIKAIDDESKKNFILSLFISLSIIFLLYCISHRPNGRYMYRRTNSMKFFSQK